MTTTPNANRKTASKKTTRRIARKLTSTFTRKKARVMSRRKQLEMKAALERHSRKCIICHHPEREAIEEEFLHWRAPWKLAEDYNLADYRTIYRHARAAGLLLQRRENLHSGLDAFVEAVDDVKFTGDTILRAMRAYSCIDRHGRWTEIPTRVSISTFRDPGPAAPSPASYPENDSDVIDIEPEQLEEDLEEDEEEYDDPEDDPDDDSSVDEDDDDSELDERSASDQTACAVSPAQAVPKLRSDSGRGRKVTATACAASPRTSRGSPAQAPTHDAAAVDDSDESDNDPDTELEELEDEVLEEHATAYAASLAQAVEKLTAGSNHRGRTATATACAASPRASRGSSAQATPRNAVRGHNPQSRSVSDHTACAAIDSNDASRRDATACVASPTQAVPPLPSDSRHRGRTVTATDCAASPAQLAQPARQAESQKSPPQSSTGRGATATACADPPAQPAPHAHAWQNPLPPPAPLTDYPPVYPIYGPAIKNHRKPRYFSSLRFSNRR